MQYIELAEALLGHLYSRNEQGSHDAVQLSALATAVGERDMMKMQRVACWLDRGGYVRIISSTTVALTASGAFLAELVRLPAPNFTSGRPGLTDLLQKKVVQL